jgi:hypothetical protein
MRALPWADIVSIRDLASKPGAAGRWRADGMRFVKRAPRFVTIEPVTR